MNLAYLDYFCLNLCLIIFALNYLKNVDFKIAVHLLFLHSILSLSSWIQLIFQLIQFAIIYQCHDYFLYSNCPQHDQLNSLLFSVISHFFFFWKMLLRYEKAKRIVYKQFYLLISFYKGNEYFNLLTRLRKYII